MLTIADFFRDPCTMQRAADPTYCRPSTGRAK
jgi:hypothetical protein